MTNKPRVDWLRILWKCHRRYKWPSAGNAFLVGQELDFAVLQLRELRKRQSSGSIGHQKPHKPVHPSYNQPPIDLQCDDPLYDNKPVF